MKRKLTFLFSGRNDFYVANFINRIEYCIDFNLRNIEKINKLNQIEFLIVDWGSELQNKISSKFKLSKAKYKNKVKFIHFKKEEIKNKFNIPGNFWVEQAVNAGIVRTKTSHLWMGHHDLILTEQSWLNIFRVIQNKKFDKNFFWIPRHFVNEKLFLKNPSHNDLNNYLNSQFISKSRIRDTNMHHGGGSCGILTRTKILSEINGINENLINKGRNSGSDANLWHKCSIKYNHIDSLTQGFVAYKLPIILKSNLKNKYSKHSTFSNRYNFNYLLKKNGQYGLNKLKKKIEYSNFISKNISLNNSKILKNKFNNIFLNKLYHVLRISIHSKYQKFEFKKFLQSIRLCFLLDFLDSLTFVNIGNPNLNKFACLSKHHPYLNVWSFIKYQNKNSLNISYILQNLNRYYNQTHDGYYRFIFDEQIISRLKQNEKSINKKIVLNLDIKGFSSIEKRNIKKFILKNQKNIYSLIFENLESKKYFNLNKFYLKLIDTDYIYYNKNLKKDKKFKILDLSKYLKLNIFETFTYFVIYFFHRLKNIYKSKY